MGIVDALKSRLFKGRRESIGYVDAICPYCDTSLRKKPSRKTKCPDCNQYIYVRTRPQDRVKILIREDQIEAIEEAWAIANGTHDEYLAEKQRYENARSELREKFGNEPSGDDVRWRLLNEDCTRYASRGDWGLYRNSRLSMAQLLDKEGKRKQAIQFYLRVCYLDLNGPCNTGGVNDPALIKEYPPFSPAEGDLAAGVLQLAKAAIDKVGLGEEQVASIFSDTARREHVGLKLPIEPNTAWLRLKQELYP